MSSVEALALNPSDFDRFLDMDQAVLDALPAAVHVCAADGTLARLNRRAAEAWGHAPRLGEPQFWQAFRLVRPDGSLIPPAEFPIGPVLRTGEAVRDREIAVERPDGSRIAALLNIDPLCGQSGRIEGAVVTLVDITGRQRTPVPAPAPAVAGEERFRDMFEGARVALWDQDFSLLVERLERLRAAGVTDPRAYFEARPEELAEATALVRVRDVNGYAAELFEAASKAELLGSLGATFLPETQPVFVDEIVALWEGRRRFESEAVVRTLKDRRITVLLAISWEGERCERSLVSILDISKQKATEHRLQTLDHIARTLSSDLDLERIVQTVTDSATRLSGARFGAFFYNETGEQGERLVLYTLSGAPRAAFERFGLPRNTAVFDPTFRGTGIVRSDDIREDPRYGRSAPHFGMPKGHLPVVSYLAVPVVSRSGAVLGGLLFGHDRPGVFTAESEEIVSGIAAHAAIALDNARLLREAQSEVEQRRRAERAEHQLAAIVQSSADAIVSKDLNGIVISWNQGAERLFGYSAAEMIGQSINIVIPPDLQHEEPKILGRIRQGEAIEHYETVRRRKDGTLFDISLTVSPVKDSSGTIIGASKIARDITDRKRTEEVLAQRAEEQSALYRFTDRLHRAQSMNDVCDAALDTILRALRCQRASILFSDATQTMRFVAWRGLSEDYRRAVEGHSPWTAETRDPQPICIDDVSTAGLSDELAATVKAEGIAALAFIPLVANGKLIGKFMSYYDRPHQFTPGEVDLAVTIARQLGFGVERRRADAHRDLLVAELSHRVKNTLATVISIAQQSFARGQSPEEARQSFNGRIRALAQTHSRLAEQNWSGVPFETMLLDEVAPYRFEDGGNIRTRGPHVTLDPKYAVVLGMAFHELATNAAKHGALSTSNGAVDVIWELSPARELRIRWIETGGPPVAPPQRNGFGRLLLERALAADLDGEVQLNFAETGLRCEIVVPLANQSAAAPRPEPMPS